MNDYTGQFLDEIGAATGFRPDKIVADGRLHRFSTSAKGGDDSGWYIFHGDGVPAGAVGDWRTGVKRNWRGDIGRELTPAENNAHRVRMNIIRAERKADEAKRHAGAAGNTMELWRAAQPCEGNPYLERKGVCATETLREIDAAAVAAILGYSPKSKGELLSGRILLAPVKIGDAISTMEMIDGAGRKSALSGGKKAGGFWAAQPMPASLETLLIGEGVATVLSAHEATGHPAIAALSSGNLEAVARLMRERYPAARLVVLADIGNGQSKALEAANAVGGLVALPEFAPDELAVDKPPSDFNDLAVMRGLAAVKDIIQGAECASGSRQTETPVSDAAGDFDATVARLAALKPNQYDLLRTAESKRLKVRTATLDDAVKGLRAQQSGGAASLFTDIEMWHDPVDGAALLDEIAALIRKFIVCDPEIADAAALWIGFSWLIDHFHIAPMILITAPEMRCGKTQFLIVMSRMVRRPLAASNLSPAVVYHVIEADAPTLLIDEADSFFRDNEDLRGIVNSGHGRETAYVLRMVKTVGDNFATKRFSTWGAKVLCGIGRLQNTLMDRSLVLELRRKGPGETAAKLRHADPAIFAAIASKLCRFADDHGAEIGQARPNIPNALHDRAQDNWEPLLAIADHAGGGWPERARSAALKMAGATAEADDLRGGLLQDIQAVFRATGQDRISTTDLLSALTADDTKPYATWARGRAMTPRHLANKLADYKIARRTFRIGGTVHKGYMREDFKDTFERYLPPSPGTPILSVTRLQPAETLGLFDNPAVTSEPGVTDGKAPNTLEINDCYHVTDKPPLHGEGIGFDAVTGTADTAAESEI